MRQVLINFSFSNFKSYREARQFSMQRTSSAQKHEQAGWRWREYSTVSGVYGVNASGKSTFLDAFGFVTRFVADGFDPNFDLGARLQPFRLDPDSRNRPSEFLVNFLGTDDVRYAYELSVDNGTVEFESLRAYGGTRTSRVFERERENGGYSYRYGRSLKGGKGTFERMARPESPYLSVLYAANAPSIKPACEFFQNCVGFYPAALYECELANLSEDLRRGTPAAKALTRLMASTDLGISVVQRKDLLDELQESSLHPVYVQELVELFKDPRTNPHQSQLIFTTHDVSLITRAGADQRVLDQDQIWLAEKDDEGRSTLYPRHLRPFKMGRELRKELPSRRLWREPKARIPRGVRL